MIIMIMIRGYRFLYGLHSPFEDVINIIMFLLGICNYVLVF